MDINRAITQLLRDVNALSVIEGIKDLENCDFKGRHFAITFFN